MNDWENVKNEVLYLCKRYCCFCERYKGRDIEVHHIIQRADGGKDVFDNAIALCFDCHSEIGSYNPRHPKGNKYKPEELKRIRNEIYVKVESLPRRPDCISDRDQQLLQEFKNDYTDILEYCKRTDFSAELVDIHLNDEIYYLEFEKWSKKRYVFSDDTLEQLKTELLKNLTELREYISEDYLRFHEPSGKLIFRNQSWEEGCKLREELRPNTLRIRRDLAKILDTMYGF